MTLFWILGRRLLVPGEPGADRAALAAARARQSISRSALNKQLYRQRLLESSEEREQGCWLRSPESLVEHCSAACWTTSRTWSRPPAAARA